MTFRDYLSLYKCAWIFFAVFFVFSAISMALDKMIPQFFAFMFMFSTALSFLSIFFVNGIILTKFRKNKKYITFYKKISACNNYSLSRHEKYNSDTGYKYIDYVNDPAYSSNISNSFHRNNH